MALYKWNIKVSWSWANPWALPTVQPSNPSAWEMYYDTTAWMPKVYNWTSWEEVGWGNVIAMTQSEYDALPAATKNDGKLRIISDAPAVEISWWFEPEDSGTTWQVLKKTDTWYNWWNIDSISTIQPSSPSAWSTYFDTTSLAVKVYDWTQWNELWSWWWGGWLWLEYMRKVTLNWSWDWEHWLNTGVWSLAYDAYVVCLTNSTCRFILWVELWDYNYPRPATNDIRNWIMQVSWDSKWLRAWEKLFIYDYYWSWAVYNFYIYKFTRPS